MVALITILISFFSLTFAAPTTSGSDSLIVHEHRDSAPNGFVHTGPAPGSTPLQLRIALVSNDMAGLEKALYDVSTPNSPHYGKHLSKEEVEEYVAPSSNTTSAVHDWLASNNLTASPMSPAGDWLSLSVDVQKANELLDAQFSVYTDTASGIQTIRTLSYSIPASLQGHVELVYPTISFPQKAVSLSDFSTPIPTNNLSADAGPASCASQVTPACLQDLYGIPATPATDQTNRLGVSGFDGEFAQADDLKSFFAKFRPDIDPRTPFALQTVDNGQDPQDPSQAGVEANLDIQYTVGVATGVPVTFISVGNATSDGISGFLDIINALLGQTAPPQVLSTSYGFNEDGIQPSLANNMCNALMQLGARGVSILFSSGDGGVSGNSKSDTCTTFVPTFPSGCPFVTSVGGTTGSGPETAAGLSSGGFSNIFPRPAYQSSIVSNYLSALGDTNSGKFNSSGRGFPDVSAQAENIAIFNGGQQITVSGTSASCPIFASAIALLNDQLSGAGKGPLGFLNPMLYSNGAALTDVTSGNNPGCGTDGFPASAGWDPVTGLGTPNFAALKSSLGL